MISLPLSRNCRTSVKLLLHLDVVGSTLSRKPIVKIWSNGLMALKCPVGDGIRGCLSAKGLLLGCNKCKDGVMGNLDCSLQWCRFPTEIMSRIDENGMF
ncbi:hypothetical protein TNCT_565591 [Trichonephila clavata]|uniref:Uncharacterized protein n=1 Tax=Trichonephila clavata TaxID=2740835 RepID=A0A8X6F566_TRICU|nr:hypothetical protein TNCT_565591 [Trichonephila clavata]